MAKKTGMEGKLYYNATPLTETTYTGITTELTNVRDVTLNLETGEADVTTRGNNGWRATMATLKDGTIEFEMVWDTSDAGFAAVRAAWVTGGEIAIACLDGAHDESGSQGLAGNFTVTNFTRNEPLEDAMTASVTIRPSSYNNWYVVGGT